MEPFRYFKYKCLIWAGFLLCFKLLIGVALTWGQHSPQPTKGEGRQLAFDQSQSSISFLASSTLHPVRGKANRFSGKILLPSLSDPSMGSVTLAVEASTLDTNHEGQNKKMRESCLEIGRFPEIRFKSLEIRSESRNYSPGQTGKAEILGLLDLHGIQKKITVPVDYNYTGETLHITGRAMVRMSDFQIPEPKFLLLRVKDEIEIVFDIRASST